MIIASYISIPISFWYEGYGDYTFLLNRMGLVPLDYNTSHDLNQWEPRSIMLYVIIAWQLY